MYYINCFFVYSILGFLFEHAVCIFTGSKGESGILYGPWTPVYGIGIILLFLIAEFIFKNLHASKILQTLVIFVAVVVILSAIELLGGILIEKFFHTTLWDYSNLKFHIGKYIALEISLLWGLLSIAILYLVKPWMDTLLLWIPPIITYLALAVFVFDLLITIGLKTNIKDYLSVFR